MNNISKDPEVLRTRVLLWRAMEMVPTKRYSLCDAAGKAAYDAVSAASNAHREAVRKARAPRAA